jgi:hypothetical protein
MPLGELATSQAEGGKASTTDRKETLQATAQPPLEKMEGDRISEHLGVT